MAKKTKPPKPAKKPKPPVYDPANWAPLEEARYRIQATVDSLEKADQTLQHLLHSGGLPSAVQWVRPDGTEAFDPVELEAWGRVSPAMIGSADLGPAYARARFHVERKKFDALFPPPGAPGADGARTRCKPGPQPKHEWPKYVGRELAQRAIDGKSVPTVKSMLDWCDRKWSWHPDDTPMRNLIEKYRELFDE